MIESDETGEDSGGIATMRRPSTIRETPEPALTPTPPPSSRWNPVHLLGFRFVFVYFVLYNLPFPLSYIPGLNITAGWYSKLWEALVPWTARVVLRLPQPVIFAPTGSGDTTFEYVRNFCIIVIALIATVVWTLRDRRPEHAKLREWLRLYVRLSLGMTMIGYGGYKVIKSQFPLPGLDRLAQPFGDLSPMGLLWAFMGFSTAYNVFTGLGEMGGGILLFFRRTALAGALLLITVLANVVILNFTFDVPVKIYSANLLLMAIWLAAPDCRRLLDLLWYNRVVQPARHVPLFATRRKTMVLQVSVLLLLAVGVITVLVQSYQGRVQYGDRTPKPPLYGLYTPSEFVRNGVVLPAVAGNSSRWARITFSGNFARIRLMNDSSRFYNATTDTVAKTVTLVPRADSTTSFTFAYVRPAPDLLILSGLFGGDSIRATFKRRDETSFLLMNRGYHWIQENPYNR